MSKLMNILINGEQITLPESKVPTARTITIALALFLEKDQQQQSFAVALNGDFIGREAYHSTQLAEQDALDILFPIQGG